MHPGETRALRDDGRGQRSDLQMRKAESSPHREGPVIMVPVHTWSRLVVS